MRLPSLVPALIVAVTAAVSAHPGRGLQLGQVGAAKPSAHEVAASLQKKYDSIRDFTADFVHLYEGGVLKKKLSERGTVQVKKPGKMRWDYQAPEKKLFVSDGRRIYLWVPADNQVMVSPVPAEDQATTAVLFLVGKGSVTRDFTVSFADGGATDGYTLKLTPKLAERDYDWLQVTVDRRTFQIQSLTALDKQGARSTFQFANFKENTGLADKTFEFKPPRGADVITTGPSR